MLTCNRCGDDSPKWNICPACIDNNKTYIFHADPGHGWLEVKRFELIRLDILDKISPYSYQKGDTVYLEEDCDAGVFLKAKKLAGEEFKVKEEYKENTPIRNYRHFQP